MPAVTDRNLSDVVRRAARPLTGAAEDYDPLMERIGDARFVLLGEASHGTHEFYRERAEITRRLIREKGFTAVAVEADWPDAYRVNRYVRGADGEDAEPLSGFRRFPTWMWRNTVVLDFVRWLRGHNQAPDRVGPMAGFYGLDLYSLHSSMEAVVAYLDKVDPDAARRARFRYSCFEHFGEDPQAYGYATRFDLGKSCEDETVNQLVDLHRRAAEYAKRDGRCAEDEYFYAEQNARLVMNAEQYYRTMFGGRASSWNLRDGHMAETLEAARRAPRSPGRADEGRRLGPQLAPRRRPRHRDGEPGRAERRPARAAGARPGRGPGRLHHAHRDRDGGLELGRAARSQASPPVARGELRGPLPRRGHAALPARPGPGGGRRGRPARTAPGARHRRHLPPGVRTREPLLPRAAVRPVRRRAPLRRDAGRRAPGTFRRPGVGRVPETFPTGI